MALEATQGGCQVEMLGDIVHNEDVVKQIENSGIQKVKALAAGENKVLLIRAHGARRATYEEATKLGYTIIDATCPMVKEIHRITEDWDEQGYTIIVIGDKKHDEVQGILGHTKSQAFVIDDINSIPVEQLKHIKKSVVVVQSTQIPEKVKKIVDLLKSYIPELKFFNTICKTTKIKQKEMNHLPLENDAIIIIGSRNSANTQRLYEISRSLNTNSYWVQGIDDLKPEWFEGLRSVGVTAGASTPDQTIQNVIERLKDYEQS